MTAVKNNKNKEESTMTSLTNEMIEKARSAKSVEELIAIAKENNIELTDNGAKKYFAGLNPQSGELSEDELNNVSGGNHCYDVMINQPRSRM